MMNLNYIILIIVVTGGVIGLVNSTGLWGDGLYDPIDLGYDLSGFENAVHDDAVLDVFTVTVTFLSTAWSMAQTALQMLFFAYPLLVDMFGVPEAIAMIFQGGIWVTVLFWLLEFFRR